ncbi:Autophagy protein 7 [Chytridiales sp. JEL 0842]|nr:Autophagy protein 7 [Chytridiales sp. JEL 0842]
MAAQSPTSPTLSPKPSPSSLLQFEPFQSAVDATFWHTLTSKKIDTFKLDDSPHPISAYYSVGGHPSPAPPARLCIGVSAFSDGGVPQGGIGVGGLLRNTNTIEDFKNLDKSSILKQAAEEIWSSILSGSALETPSKLAHFVLITFADLKKYKFFYWFAFPALLPVEHFKLDLMKPLKDAWAAEEMEAMRSEFEKARAGLDNAPFFLIKRAGNTVTIGALKEWSTFWTNVPESERLVGFADPSSLPSNPGWPLRNLLILLKKSFNVSTINILCYRDAKKDMSASMLLQITLPGSSPLPETCPKVVGWEKNAAGKLGPRLADLAPLMDPTRLAETAVDLNLKLMRWRILPDLQLEKVAGTKCLLLGAGTLGSYVARALMAWGVRHITFVDNGDVSFSNPVRQPLYEFQDSVNGGKPKALAAADALKRIFPGITSRGYKFSIPMPGHPPTSPEGVRKDIALLEKLVGEHDVIYLLTDSREARWLPSVMGAAMGKIVINSALGFDTFLVMRHGMKPIQTGASNLGCYFCNDVVAPTDSLSDRTLDQQCTVTRPGLSLLASGLAVELMVSILNHPNGGYAPADATTPPTEPTAHPLGLVPHQIRGYLTHFNNLLVTGHAYDKCTACSQLVLEEFKKSGAEFVLKCMESPKYLEEVTGLAELQREVDEGGVGDWGIDDEDEDDF